MELDSGQIRDISRTLRELADITSRRLKADTAYIEALDGIDGEAAAITAKARGIARVLGNMIKENK